MTVPPAVRRAGAADVGRASELFSQYREFYEQSGDVAGAADFLRARLERGESMVWLAESDDRVVGFVQVYPTFASIELGAAWRLNDLYVVESARRTGVGAALMDAVHAAAKAAGVCWIDLETASNNSRAQRLYERAGYVRDDQYVHYVRSIRPDE